MRLAVIFFGIFFSLSGCSIQPRPPSAEDQARLVSVLSDFADRKAEMVRRFPPGNIGSDSERQTFASQLIQQHVEFRNNAGLPYVNAAFQPSLDLNTLAAWPERDARFQMERQTRQRTRELTTQIAALDGRQLLAADITRLAAARLDAQSPDLRGAERRSALLTLDAEIRREVEARRRNTSNAAISTREIDLTRLARTNLADMPREILRGAEANLADARSPFDLRANWRPDPVALRQEEVRLRAAIGQRIEANTAAAQANDLQIRRQQAAAMCEGQAAQIEASMFNPRSFLNLDGAIAGAQARNRCLAAIP